MGKNCDNKILSGRNRLGKPRNLGQNAAESSKLATQRRQPRPVGTIFWAVCRTLCQDHFRAPGKISSQPALLGISSWPLTSYMRTVLDDHDSIRPIGTVCGPSKTTRRRRFCFLDLGGLQTSPGSRSDPRRNDAYAGFRCYRYRARRFDLEWVRICRGAVDQPGLSPGPTRSSRKNAG